MLKNKKISLRSIEDRDLEKRVQWINDPAVNHTLNFEIPISLFSTRQWLSRVSQSPNRKDFTVFLNDTNTPIGWAGFLGISSQTRKAEIYGGIGEISYWGQGIAQDIWSLLIEYGFTHLALNKIYSTVWVDNIAMCHIHEKLGFVREGTLRQDIMSHGILRDRHYYGLLKEDYINNNDSY